MGLSGQRVLTGCCMRRVGDGDCGSTLRRGAEAVQAAVAESLPLNDAAAALAGIAAALRAMGGTSGALYNIAVTAAAGGGLHPGSMHALPTCSSSLFLMHNGNCLLPAHHTSGK